MMQVLARIKISIIKSLWCSIWKRFSQLVIKDCISVWGTWLSFATLF